MKPWKVALVPLGVLGCAEAEPGSRHQAGDTTFVHSAEALRDTASLREVLRIGVMDGEPEYMFAGLVTLTVGPEGDVFVADLEGEVRRYDPEGRFVGTIARQGQGPGEVHYVIGMDVSGDGRLALADLGNGRVSIYSEEGEFIRQIFLPPGRPAYGRGAILWDENGEIWLSLNPPRAGPDTLRAGAGRPIYGRLVSDRTVADTVFLPHRASDGCTRRHHSHARGFYEDDRIRFLPFAQWARAGDGTLVFGCSARYAFDVVSPDGSVTRASRRWEPAVMDGPEYAFWAELADEVARERPAYLRLWRSDDGRIWAWPGTAGHTRESTAVERELGGLPPIRWEFWSRTDGFDVFEPDGRWLGHVRTPSSWGARPFPGTEDPFFRGDTIWALTRDELGVTYVSRFVVEWPQ